LNPSRCVTFAAFAFSCVACAELPTIEVDTCGNGAIESSEDCDGASLGGLTCGSPGTSRACRFLCGGPQKARCPSGWGCAADGLCRQASGAFINVKEPIREQCNDVQLADFDGDGVQDLLLTQRDSTVVSVSTPRVAKLDRSGQALSIDPVGPLVVSPVAADVNRDGRSDLVFGTLSLSNSRPAGGIATLSKTYAGQYVSLPYEGVDTQGLRVRVVNLTGVEGVANPTTSIVMTPLLGATYLSSLAIDAPPGKYGKLPFSLDDLAGEVVGANVVDAASSPCDELVYLVRGSGHVDYASVCDSSGELTMASPPKRLLDVPLDTTRIALADIDGDSHVDIVASSPARTLVGLGVGDGSVRGNRSYSLALDFASPGAGAEPPEPTELEPIGVGRLPGGATVFATKDAAFATSRGTFEGDTFKIKGSLIAVRIAGDWSFARFGDINRDGFGDVVLASKGSNGLDVLLGTARNTLFTRTTLSTEASTTAVALVDSDGDGTRDIAVSDSSGALRVAFGNASAAPSKPRLVAQLGEVSHLKAGIFDSASASEAIVVVSGGPTETLSVFLSDGQRTPISSTQLRTDQNNGIPATLVAGHFFGPDRLDAFMCALDASATGPEGFFRMWAVSSLEEARHRILAGAKLDEVEATGSATDPTPPVQLIAADTDGDGVDEAWLSTQNARGEIVLRSFRVDGDGVRQTRRLIVQGDGRGEGRLLSAIDIDRDGRTDLAVATKSSVVVAWNDGDTFSFASIATFAPPTSMTTATLRADRGKELLILDKDKVSVVRSRDGRSLFLEVVPGLGGGVSFVTGDLDGDGVDDVVTSSGKDVQVARGAPVLQ
jgi:hypothetical protein